MDLSDYYITVDQLYDRFTNFTYDNDVDILTNNSQFQKDVYNFSDKLDSKTLNQIRTTCDSSMKKLFEENRQNDKLDKKAKKDYREKRKNESGDLFDDLTGQKGNKTTHIKNGKEYEASDIHADHIQAREAAMYNTRYIRNEKVQNLKEFINSDDNMQLLSASANTSKGDVRVCINNKNQVVYLNAKSKEYKDAIDITYKATPEQLADAAISQWEKETTSGDKTRTLKEKGYLDDNGKVKDSVRQKLINNIKNSQNQESIVILQSANYQQIAKDAALETKKSFGKILAGQIIYYVLPPTIYETKLLIKSKDITIDNFISKLKKSGSRIINYVTSKLKEIFKNIAFNSLNKFIKTFFDILIEITKATVKRILKAVKDLILSLVNCVKVIINKSYTPAQKADAITKILAVSINAIVLEILFEYLEKQFNIPDFIMEPLQIIVSAIMTNIIMLVLQKADLFNVEYGLITAKIDNIFQEEFQLFLEKSDQLMSNNYESSNHMIKILESELEELQDSIKNINLYSTDVTQSLNKINEIFEMGIDFEKEWSEYIM